jgi:hypothetical protein
MKLTTINKNIKCDTVLCNENASFELVSNSYKGNAYLCDKCMFLMQNILKKVSLKNENKAK